MILLQLALFSYQTHAKCKTAAEDFQSLASQLYTAGLLVNSVRNAVEDAYNDLPPIHQRTLAVVMAGMHATLQQSFRLINPHALRISITKILQPTPLHHDLIEFYETQETEFLKIIV